MTNKPSSTDGITRDIHRSMGERTSLVGDDELVARLLQIRGTQLTPTENALYTEAADRITDLQARLERYREALRPFASHVGKSGEKVTLTIGKDTWTGTLTTDDFESARKALGDTHEG